MTGDQAGQIIGFLAAGFPRDAIEGPTVELWVVELQRLPLATVAMDAATRIVRAGDKFPNLGEFRLAYRQALDRHNAGRELTEPDDSVPPPPETQEWMNERGILRDVPDA